METKQFLKNLLLRAIPFFAFVIALIVLKVADVQPSDWWGWYVMYVLIIASLAFALYYGVKNSKGMIIENVKKSYIKKVAKQYLSVWDDPKYSTENIINYIYQNERNFDRTISERSLSGDAEDPWTAFRSICATVPLSSPYFS